MNPPWILHQPPWYGVLQPLREMKPSMSCTSPGEPYLHKADGLPVHGFARWSKFTHVWPSMQVPGGRSPRPGGEPQRRHGRDLPGEADVALRHHMGRLGVGDARRDKARRLRLRTVRGVIRGVGDGGLRVELDSAGAGAGRAAVPRRRSGGAPRAPPCWRAGLCGALAAATGGDGAGKGKVHVLFLLQGRRQVLRDATGVRGGKAAAIFPA